MQETIEESKIGRIHSSCKNCFFSVWKDKTQTGCSLGLIDKYREQAEVVEVFDEVGDEFFVINGKHCQFKRSNIWGHRFNKNHDNAYVAARKENYPKVELFIYLDNLDNTAFAHLDKTLESIEKDKISGIRLINNSLQDPTPLSQHFQQKLFDLDLNSVSWSCHNIIESANYNRACDITIKQSKAQYFLVGKAGFKLPKKQLDKLDKLLNDEFKPFSLIYFDDETYLSSVILYKMTGGNRDRAFIEKIRDAAKAQDREELVIHG